jgi:ribosomal protein S18 acetylase RimI-like enzyme
MNFELNAGQRAAAIDSAEIPLPETEPPQPDIPGHRLHLGRLDAGAISLQRAQPADQPFLFEVYSSTRASEMALTGWLPTQQEQFLKMQFEAQNTSYRMQFPNAEYWVIRSEHVAAGRIIVNRTADEILLVDIALLPEHRNKKIGSFLLDRIFEEARQSGKTVRVHVERFNPALRWYDRNGFRTISESEIYLEMVWRPDITGGTR